MEKLNVSCLKTDKAKRLKELNSMSIGLDSTIDNVIFKEQINLAKDLVSELQKDNQKFIFALKNWDDNQVSFICKPATFTSLDGGFGMNFEYQALDIDVNGYFEFEYFEEMIKDFKHDTRLIEKYLEDINALGFEKTLTLDSHDVAKILKVQTRTIVNWAKDNIGPKCKKIGKSYIYTKRDIAEFLADN